MVETASIMVPLGTQAPDFVLRDVVTEKDLALRDIEPQKGLLILFIANHCPFIRTIMYRAVHLIREYQAQGVAALAISSSDISLVPEDGPAQMKKFAQDHQFSFPYLFDSTQSVAKSYGAACTPDFFLFDSKKRLFYRGRFDDSTPGNNKPVTGADLRAALSALLTGDDPPEVQNPSLGCNIKWRPGNEPDYFGAGVGRMENGTAIMEPDQTYQ